MAPGAWVSQWVQIERWSKRLLWDAHLTERILQEQDRWVRKAKVEGRASWGSSTSLGRSVAEEVQTSEECNWSETETDSQRPSQENRRSLLEDRITRCSRQRRRPRSIWDRVGEWGWQWLEWSHWVAVGDREERWSHGTKSWLQVKPIEVWQWTVEVTKPTLVVLDSY